MSRQAASELRQQVCVAVPKALRRSGCRHTLDMARAAPGRENRFASEAGVVVQFKNCFKRGGNPVVSRRAVMRVIGVAVLKKSCQVAAATINKEAFLGFEIAADHVCDSHETALFEFHGVQFALVLNRGTPL